MDAVSHAQGHGFGSFFEVRTRNNAGEEVDFAALKGNVVLAVNVARL